MTWSNSACIQVINSTIQPVTNNRREEKEGITPGLMTTFPDWWSPCEPGNESIPSSTAITENELDCV